MMLFSEDQMQALDRLALQKVERVENTLRIAQFGPRGERTPVGYIRLTKPEDQQVWTDHLRRQALAEQEGRAPGDTAVSILDNPIMQGMGQS